MSQPENQRQVYSLFPGFFNDGHWYVLSSTSRGGSELSPDEMVQRLQSSDPEVFKDLLRRGICLPLFFDGDCALDGAKIVVGDLTAREEEEWIGRIQSRLEIPCGEFLFMGGGGLEEDWEAAIENFEPTDVSNFTKVKVAPGTYLVELYAFVTSMTFNVAWDCGGIMSGVKETKESLSQWWESSRPGEEFPEWLVAIRDKKFLSSSDLGLLEYLVRIRPWRDIDSAIPTPPLVSEIKPHGSDVNWCGVFEYRRSIPCPRGLRLNEV